MFRFNGTSCVRGWGWGLIRKGDGSSDSSFRKEYKKNTRWYRADGEILEPRSRSVSSRFFSWTLLRNEVEERLERGFWNDLLLSFRAEGPENLEAMGQKPFVRTFPTEEELENRAGEPLSSFENKEHVVREKMVEVETVKVRLSLGSNGSFGVSSSPCPDLSHPFSVSC